MSARKNPTSYEKEALRRGSGYSLAIDPGLKNVALDTFLGYPEGFLILDIYESLCPPPSLPKERIWPSEEIDCLALGVLSLVAGSLPNFVSNPFCTALALSKLIVVIHSSL